ncbi:MAG TPA: alpha/beta fold hydrolase [Polyangiaceae bacterium]|jgi:alpha-beta hydrolase superfamily lysophospholipase|nr:alpha/beta fold hydrolase [Polyangiaceae bacterium]
MILNSTVIEQTIDRDERARFDKDLVVVRAPNGTGEGTPLAMIRKRLHGIKRTLAPVVLIHGYGQNRYAWHLPSRSFFNYLAKAGFDVFNLELRGHGRSRHLGAHPPRDPALFVEEDVPAALAEVSRLSGGRPIYLVGHSLGGLIAYASAAANPEHVAGVVTLGSPYQFTRGSLSLKLFSKVMLAFDQRVHLGHGALELKPLSETMRLLRGFIESPIFPIPIRGFAPKSLEPNILGQHMALAMDTGSISVLRQLFLSAAEARAGGHCLGELTGYADEFEALDLPLLVIAGGKDDLAPPASVEPAYHRSRSTDKTYRCFPRGHIDLLAGRDCPQTIWPLVASWLSARVRRREAATSASQET